MPIAVKGSSHRIAFDDEEPNFNLLPYSHNLSIPKYLRPNVNNHHIQDMDELLHRRPIHLNNMGNGYIQIRHIPYPKWTHLHNSCLLSH